MVRKLGLLMGLCLPMTSQAQDFIYPDGFVLTSEPGTWRARGVASPSVAYDDDNDEFVMFYTARFPDEYIATLSEDYSGCTAGVFGIGRAVSPDGINWTPDPADGPVIAPVPDTYRACHVARVP